RDLLDALAKVHLGQHDNDPQRSLAALSSADEARQALEEIQDPDVVLSLRYFRNVPRPEPRSSQNDVSTVGRPTEPGPGRFRILRQHAKGGLGIVYVAHDQEINRQVALKEIQRHRADDADNRARFKLEAEIAGGLEHPGIVPVYGLGHYADGRPYYAMR